jgi:large subunit ribosomal protein L22
MQVTAQLKNLRIAPRKVRPVSDLIKGLDVSAAKSQLDHLIKKSARPILKLLDSAAANARSNFGLIKENLFIKDIIVNEGIKLKRFRPKGFGSVSPIHKKTSSIKIILEEKVPGLKVSPPERKEEIEKPAAEEGAEVKISEKGAKVEAVKRIKPEIKKEIGKRGLLSKIAKRFFRRKAI